MMTNIIMFVSLAAMATVKLWQSVPEGAFLITITEKTPIHSSKKPIFADHVYIGLSNEPKMPGWR